MAEPYTNDGGCVVPSSCAVPNLESSEGAEVAVQHQHGQRGELSGTVPAVAAVDHHRVPTAHFICYLDGSRQHQLHSREDRIHSRIYGSFPLSSSGQFGSAQVGNRTRVNVNVCLNQGHGPCYEALLLSWMQTGVGGYIQVSCCQR